MFCSIGYLNNLMQLIMTIGLMKQSLDEFKRLFKTTECEHIPAAEILRPLQNYCLNLDVVCQWTSPCWTLGALLTISSSAELVHSRTTSIRRAVSIVWRAKPTFIDNYCYQLISNDQQKVACGLSAIWIVNISNSNYWYHYNCWYQQR